MISFPSDVTISEISGEPVCGVVAVAVATSKPFKYVKQRIASTHKSNWRGSMRHSEITSTIKKLGAELTRDSELTQQYRERPLHEFVRYSFLKNPNSTYLVFTTKHVQVVRSNMAVDQGGLKKIGDYRWRRKKINSIYEIKNNSDENVNMELVMETVKETEQVAKKETKFMKAERLIPEFQLKEMKCKEIIAELAKELETTWASASTFYYRVLRKIKTAE